MIQLLDLVPNRCWLVVDVSEDCAAMDFHSDINHLLPIILLFGPDGKIQYDAQNVGNKPNSTQV